MQVKVPQQLLTYEDKVIGPLSFRQFIYLVIGIGLAIAIIASFPSGLKIVGFVLAAPILGLFVVLAFLKLQGRSTEVFVKAIIVTLLKPRLRIWRRETSYVAPPAEKKKEAPVAKKKEVREIRSSLEQLATVLDTGGTSAGVYYPPEEKVVSERVIRPEAELPTEEAAPDLIEDAARQKSLSEALTEVEEKTAELAKKMPEPPVSKITEPAKQYDYDYEKLEINPAKSDELESMVFQYHRTHPARKLRILKHGEKVQISRPIEEVEGPLEPGDTIIPEQEEEQQ